MKLTVDIKLDDLARDICCELNDTALLKLIKDIDLGVADWSFTEKLYKYFKKEIEKNKEYNVII
jgi:hypothetical protein